MIYVNNAFSSKMLQNVDNIMNVKFSFIDEAEFRSAIETADKIVIGHEDTAKYFNVLMNRQTITLNKGDVLFVCEANARDGGRLPSGTQFLAEMGEGVYFRFLKIEL